MTPGTCSAVTHHGTGTSVGSIRAGAAPSGAFSVVLRAVHAGTVSAGHSTQATCQISLDGGTTFGSAMALPISAHLEVSGIGHVNFNFSDGTVVAGDTYAFTTTAPTSDSELTTLFAIVRDRLALESPGVSVVFGRREPTKQVNQGTGRAHRIVFQPGGPGGDAGDEAAPRYPGSSPRPLKDELEAFTVYVWGYDRAVPTDEARQHDAAWSLFRAWRRAMYLAPADAALLGKRIDPIEVRAKRWRKADQPERLFGAELEIDCAIRSPVLDEVFGVSQGIEVESVEANIAVTEKDQTVVATTKET